MTTPFKFSRLRMALLAAGLCAGLSAGLAACGGGGGGGGGGGYGSVPAAPAAPVAPVAGSIYAATSLVVDADATVTQYGVESTRTVDPNLVNAWGLAFNPTGFVWVANNGTSTSSLYDGNGVLQTLVVAVAPGKNGISKPTGIVFNPTKEFTITQGALSGVGAFLFAGEGGTISAWASGVDRTHALTAYDGSASGAVYKGLAIGSFAGVNYIYATDFHNNRVDIFDGKFNKVTLAGGFKDASLPAGYAPYGIQAIGDKIYVTYAKQDAGAQNQVAGAGLGIVDVFDGGGNLVKQLVPAGGALNAAWGLALAPSNFGLFSGALLVSNFGDGKVNAYDPVSGALRGTLGKADGTPIVVDGLWGIAFGNGVSNQPTNTLYFTAGPSRQAHGSYGRIDPK